MELVIAIQSEEDLSLLKSPWNSPLLTGYERETCTSLRETFLEHTGVDQPQRVTFGSEFCQYRLVNEEALLHAYIQVRNAGYQFTLTTPYVPQGGLNKLKELLTALAEFQRKEGDPEKVEVVVNDWGVFNYVKKYNFSFTPVLGRLLSKMIRDPRVTQHYNIESAPFQAKTVFKQASYSVDYYQDFLTAAGVRMMELDVPLQGIDWNSDKSDLQLAFHLGFGTVATGRTCLVGSLHEEKSEKFRGHIVCKQQCRHYTAEMVNHHPRIDAIQQRIFQKGNSVFYQQTSKQIQQAWEMALKYQAARVIYSPRIPV